MRKKYATPRAHRNGLASTFFRAIRFSSVAAASMAAASFVPAPARAFVRSSGRKKSSSTPTNATGIAGPKKAHCHPNASMKSRPIGFAAKLPTV